MDGDKMKYAGTSGMGVISVHVQVSVTTQTAHRRPPASVAATECFMDSDSDKVGSYVDCMKD